MHYHCEIIMPPTDNIEEAVESIMKPFNEAAEDDEDCRGRFWDWWVIGGRFAGNKQLAKCDKTKLDMFYAWCKEEKITVSSFKCGKQGLQPETQIPKVDTMWNEMFPPVDGKLRACPIFKHSNNQYGDQGKSSLLEDDICPLNEALGVECDRVIFAGPSYNHEGNKHNGPLEATFMICRSQWNGVNHMDIDWDGTVQDALSKFEKRMIGYGKKYLALIKPQDDWMTITVDYHS